MGGANDARALQARQAQSRRDQILAATHGGHDGPTGYSTDFAATSNGGLVGLRRMVEDADPGTLDQIAAKWTAISNALTGAQEELLAHTQAATGHWSGAAADGFAKRAGELHESLGNGAAYAGKLSFGVSFAADSLRTAKQSMPKVPGLWDRASRAVTSETNANQFNQDLASGMTRDAALKLDGSQLSLTEERRQQAIVVLQQLEGQYHAAATVIGTPVPVPVREYKGVYPPAPPAAHAPVSASDGAAATAPRQSVGPASGSGAAGGRIPGFGTPASPGRSKAMVIGTSAEPLPAGTVIDGRSATPGTTGTLPASAPGAGAGPAGSTGIDGGSPLLIGGGTTGPIGSQQAVLGIPVSTASEQGHAPGSIAMPRNYGHDGPPPVEESVYVTPAAGPGTTARVAVSPEAAVRRANAGENAQEVHATPTPGDEAPGDTHAGTGVSLPAAEASSASAAEHQSGGEGMMPSGMGSGMGAGGSTGTRRRGSRRRAYSADEQQRAVGEEFAGAEGINEWLLPRAEAEQDRLARVAAELGIGRTGGERLPLAGITPSRGRRKQQVRSRARYLLQDEETWRGSTANPPVVQ
jgi:hypothetical protein